MQAMFGLWGIGFAELLILLSTNGLIGLPVGVPPQPEDPLLARIAPDECLFYSSWSGMAKPDPTSSNATEQLLAEQELRQMVAAIERVVRRTLRESTEGDEDAAVFARLAPRLAKSIVTNPAAFFLESVEPNRDGAQFTGGAVIKLDDEIGAVRNALRRLQAQAFGDSVKTIDIDDATYHQIHPSEAGAAVTWGAWGNYLIVGVGDDAVQSILRNAKTDPPNWMTELKQELNLPRISSVSHINVDQVLDTVVSLVGIDAARFVSLLGIDRIATYQSVTGLDEQAFVNRQRLVFDGEPTGLFKFADVEGLTADDLRSIPSESPVALAFKLDPAQVFETFVETMGRIDPAAIDDLDQAIDEAEEIVEFSIRNDLIGSLGDVWTLYASPTEGGVFTGWTATVQIRDRMTLQPVQDRLVQLARSAFNDGTDDGETLRQMQFAGHRIFYLAPPDDDFPLSPAWCLMQRELVLGLFPQSVKAHIAQRAGADSLVKRPEIAREFQNNDGPIAISFFDSREIFEVLYPLIQVTVQMALNEARDQDVDLDISLLPSAASIAKHLRPAVSVVRSVEGNIETISRQPIPGGSVGATAPVLAGLLLPAISAARRSARRAQSSNNLRQIALAMHNYHDVRGAFPPTYSTDGEGNPLLSWRVHILPYLEQQALYDRFRLDEPWDSAHNRQLIPLIPQTLRSPVSNSEAGRTNYLAIGGRQSVIRTPNDDERRQQFPTGASLADVTDGTSNTILAVEASDERAVIWTRPSDLDPDMMRPLDGLLGLYSAGLNAVMADGSVHFIHDQIDAETLRRLFQRNDGQFVELP